MNEVLATRTRAEWVAAFDAAGVPVGPVHTIGEAVGHPQMLARGMIVETRPPAGGPDESARLPDPLLGHAHANRRVPRRCSASTRANCCGSTAMTDAGIDALVAAGVVESASGQ